VRAKRCGSAASSCSPASIVCSSTASPLFDRSYADGARLSDAEIRAIAFAVADE